MRVYEEHKEHNRYSFVGRKFQPCGREVAKFWGAWELIIKSLIYVARYSVFTIVNSCYPYYYEVLKQIITGMVYIMTYITNSTAK